MKLIKGVLQGIIIGIGAVAPGISGGTFAMMLGIYDDLMDCVASFYKDVRRKLLFLLPIGLGMAVGVLFFSNVIQFLFEHYNTQVRFAFIGLMVGTLPYMRQEANKQGFKAIYLLPCALALAVTVGFAWLEGSAQSAGSAAVVGQVGQVPGEAYGLLQIFELLGYGAVIGLGTIVPGLSSSFMLMYLGAYERLLAVVVNVDIIRLIPVGLGAGFSVLLLAKVITTLFKRAYGPTYYTVLGFVLGSVVALLPMRGFGVETLTGITLAVLGALFSYWFSALGTKGIKRA